MSEETDWESVMFHLHQDRHLMQVHEAFVDLISGRTGRYNSLDPFNSGFFGHDYGNLYVEDDDYTDDDSDYEDRRKEFCGFPRNFLDNEPPRSRSPHPPHPPYKKGLRQIMHEQAEKNAKELVEEEERLKVKAEKKRLKKLRQKERKRKEKEKDQENSNNKEDSPEIENSNAKCKFSNGESVCEKSDKPAAGMAADIVPAERLKKTQASAPSVPNKPNSNRPSEDEEEEEDEGEDGEVESITSELEVLDMSSCFVSKAATIAKRKLELKAKLEKREGKGKSPGKQEQPKPPPQQQQQQKPQQQYAQRPIAEPRPRGVEQQQQQQQNTEVASIEDVIKKSTELAVIGNHWANAGRFDMAVVYFTDAIKHNPKDFRLFGNRSFCYEKMQLYEKALTDADISLAMSPNWIRGLYRKGRALTGLKRYSEAAAAFKELLQLDSTSSDAAQELMRVQIMQLMEMGFSRERSSHALIIYGTVEKALEAFSNIQDEKFGSSNPLVPSASQSAEEEWVVAGQKAHPPVNRVTPPPTQPIAKPRPQPPVKSNLANGAPLELFPVWVGNLVSTVTESTVHKLFSTVGPIHSVKMLPSRRCAFVNYKRESDCDTAIAEFHGMGLEGAVLSVRYPDRIHPHLGASKSAKQATELPPEVVPKAIPMMPGECVFWRNSGCIKKERCNFRHIPSHKGIDRGREKV